MFLIALGVGLLAYCFHLVYWPQVHGDMAAAENALSSAARELQRLTFEGLDPRSVIDGHVHVACTGTDANWKTDCSLHPNALSPWLPHHWLRGKAFLAGFGIAASSSIDGVDDEVVRILVDRLRHVRLPGDARHARGLVLAFDKHYRADGTEDDFKTGFYVSNDYVMDLARRFPDALLPAGSVHPYRRDAIGELERLAARGIRVIKWLPNVQGMDPADPACDGFYDAMVPTASFLSALRHGCVGRFCAVMQRT
jgi:mannonate dehydratase